MPLHVAGVGALQKCLVTRVAGVLLTVDPDVVKLGRVSLVVSVIGNDVDAIGVGAWCLGFLNVNLRFPLSASCIIWFKCSLAWRV